jgi:hypothetical protein
MKDTEQHASSRTQSVFGYLKAAAAIILLTGLAFPLSTCTYYVDAEGRRIHLAQGQAPPEGARKVVEREYALDDFHVSEAGSWELLFSFVWPALAAGVFLWRRRGRAQLVLRCLEPLLLAGSFALIDFRASFLTGARASGAYIAYAGLLLYGVAAAWDDVVMVRAWLARRRRQI